MGFFKKKNTTTKYNIGMKKTREGVFANLKNILTLNKSIDDDLFEAAGIYTISTSTGDAGNIDITANNWHRWFGGDTNKVKESIKNLQNDLAAYNTILWYPISYGYNNWWCDTVNNVAPYQLFMYKGIFVS